MVGFEKENRALLENTTDSIIVLQEGIVKYVNSNASRTLGYDVARLVDHPYGEFVYPEDLSLVNERYERRRNMEPVPHVYPFRMITKNGDIIWFEIHAIEIMWEGKPASLTFFNNINQRILAEKALSESEKVNRAILNAIPDTIFQISKNGVISGYKASECAFEKEGDRFTGTPLSKLLTGKTLEDTLNAVRHALATRKVQIFEFDVKTKGVTTWYEARVVPLNGEEVLSIIRNITQRKTREETLIKNEETLRNRLHRLETRIINPRSLSSIIGHSKAMQEVFENIFKAAETSAHVIIYGESGTGKELVSRAIHDLSDRADKKFIPVNCAAIPEHLMESEFFGHKKGAFSGAVADKKGLMELADGGTLFMDELGEIDLNMQAKLLRAIEGGGFMPVGGTRVVSPDIRIIGATNKNLSELVSRGQMRGDFFYRVSIIPITLPPLRKRLEDLPALICHFLEKLGMGDELTSIPPDVLRRLHAYSWPGNIRELQNVIHRYVTMNRIDIPDTPEAPPSPAGNKHGDVSENLKQATADFEKEYILNTLRKNRWQKAKTAQVLGIHRKTLFRKLSAFGIE